MRHLLNGRTSVTKIVGLALFALNIAQSVYAGYKNAAAQEIIREMPEQATDNPKIGSMKPLIGIGMVLFGGFLLIRSRHRSKSTHIHKT
jgi:hypothetical protein